jgi:hypothetical protein
MRFARWVFRIAGFYGVIIVAPMFFFERKIAPGLTHPVFYYAWLSVDLAWQILFLVLSTDPVRYRPMMLVCVLEKAAAAIAIPWLYASGRLEGQWLAVAAVDLVFSVLFLMSYRSTPRVPASDDD